MTEPEYLIKYRCPRCGHRWHEVYSCACDSECPQCELKAITALEYEELTCSTSPASGSSPPRSPASTT